MKMVAKPNPMETCESILSYLKKPNLNFQLSESPFAANIEIKKSFIRNKDGSERRPVFEELPSSLKHESQILVAYNSALKISLAEKDTLRNTIKELEMKVKNLTQKQNDDHFFPYSSNSWPAFKSEAINYNYEPGAAIMNHHCDNSEHNPHKFDDSWPLKISQLYPRILPRTKLETKPAIIPVPKPSYSLTPSRTPAGSPGIRCVQVSHSSPTKSEVTKSEVTKSEVTK